MTEATRHPPGTPCWVSLMVHGLEATQAFYGELFGWEFSPGPQQLGPYVRALIDGNEVAGIGRLPVDRHLPTAWTPYLATDDADVTAEAVRSCGGTLGVGPLDAGDAGRMAIVTDLAGAVFGLWQPAAHAGTALHGTHGTPVWNELLTTDTQSVTKFYQAVFGYDAKPDGDPGEDRVTLCLDGRPVAALHGVPSRTRDRGSHWMTWFEVEDPDMTARQITRIGGQVLEPPADGPHGRLARVADPEGAVFTIVRSLR
ncbi:VOC family protein [Streptomyces sp. NBC_01167]|uniref:VOC family protein n=1 Tax=Streptomyces sp. NBC_01167 TaxID=2903756 RepID=UPI0038646627|nr:VOC family protein [Streptomyces sp. NBC_01167]